MKKEEHCALNTARPNGSLPTAVKCSLDGNFGNSHSTIPHKQRVRNEKVLARVQARPYTKREPATQCPRQALRISNTRQSGPHITDWPPIKRSSGQWTWQLLAGLCGSDRLTTRSESSMVLKAGRWRSATKKGSCGIWILLRRRVLLIGWTEYKALFTLPELCRNSTDMSDQRCMWTRYVGNKTWPYFGKLNPLKRRISVPA